MSEKRYSRRNFIEDGAKAALGIMIVPRFVLGGKGYRAPSDKLDLAFVGIGGMGMEKSVDAVVIATPDHTHAVIAVAAMQAGKHVYVQKPLTTTVYEARLLARTARETKRVSQMGNQGHSREGTRRIVELIGA